MRQTIGVLVLLCSCGGSGGGSIGQSTACKDYLACDAKTLMTSGLDATYGPMGSCWMSTQAAADACTSHCTSELDSLKQDFPSHCN